MRSTAHFGSDTAEIVVCAENSDQYQDRSVMSELRLSQYLSRIGLQRNDIDNGVDRGPDLDTLIRVAAAQLDAVPFENFDIHADRPVSVDVQAIVEKLIDRRRGGICYELNGLLALALRTIGYDAQLIGASVLVEGVPGPPLGHVCIVVALGEGRWLVDVGFGGDAVFVPMPDLVAVDVRLPGGSAYRTEGRVRPLHEFASMAWWHSTSPKARFTQSIVCSASGDGTRRTLSQSAGEPFRFTVTGPLSRTSVLLEHDDVASLLVREFGLTLPEIPHSR